MKHSTHVLTSLLLLAAALAPFQAWSQAFPAKPIKIITTFAPGSVIDITARTIGQRLSDRWGQAVTIENRPGGGGPGTVGTDFAATSPADGYTWLLAPNSVMIIGPHLVKAPFDVFKDFMPLGQVATTPFLLVVSPQIPVRTVQELIDYAKANPGKLNYGSAGAGTTPHMAGEMFKSLAGVTMTHVAYKGSPQSTIDLMAGRLDLIFANPATSLPHIRQGRLRVLAITAARRDPSTPEMPTIAETVPGFEMAPWWGLFAPAGTPREVMAKLNAESARILALAEIKAHYANLGMLALSNTPEQFNAYVQEEIARWAKVVKATGAKVD